MATRTKANLQGTIKRLAAINVMFGLAMTYIMWVCVPIEVPHDPSLTTRLVFTLRWLILSIIPILVGVRLVGQVRFENIDTAGAVTTTPYAEDLVRLRQRALQNTLEQTALHVPIMLVFGTYLDVSYLKLVPIIVCLFVFGRIMFYIGYIAIGDQLGRGFGFGLSLNANLIPLAYCLYCMVRSGATYGLSVP